MPDPPDIDEWLHHLMRAPDRRFTKDARFMAHVADFRARHGAAANAKRTMWVVEAQWHGQSGAAPGAPDDGGPDDDGEGLGRLR